MAAEAKLLPRGHLLRLSTWSQLRAALAAVPPALRERVRERVRAAHGDIDFEHLAAMRRWLEAPPGVAQPVVDGDGGSDGGPTA